MSAELDTKVASLLDKHAENVAAASERKEDLSDDEDDLIAELEKEDAVMDGFRERRIQQLHDEYDFELYNRGAISAHISLRRDLTGCRITDWREPRR